MKPLTEAPFNSIQMSFLSNVFVLSIITIINANAISYDNITIYELFLRKDASMHNFCAMSMGDNQIVHFEDCMAPLTQDRAIEIQCLRKFIKQPTDRREVLCHRGMFTRNASETLLQCEKTERLDHNCTEFCELPKNYIQQAAIALKCQETVLEEVSAFNATETQSYFRLVLESLRKSDAINVRFCDPQKEWPQDVVAKALLCNRYSGLLDKETSNQCSTEIWNNMVKATDWTYKQRRSKVGFSQ